jgi:hypothetical protein
LKCIPWLRYLSQNKPFPKFPTLEFTAFSSTAMPSESNATPADIETQDVCFISDDALVEVLATTIAGSEAYAEACAEVCFRFWLYRGQCPDSILSAIATLKSQHPDLYKLAMDLRLVREKPLAKDVQDEDSVFEKHAGETVIEALLKNRVLTFRKAHGIIPLVLRENGFAFPVPFEMTRRFRFGSCCYDVEGNPVEAWSENLAYAMKALDTEEGIKILCKLPHVADANSFEDDGYALPVALASYNLDHYAEINPLDVLTTGAISDGGIVGAQAVEAKVALARKMGVYVWAQPSPCDKDANAPHRVLALGNAQPLKQALEAIRASLAESGMAKATVRHAREIIARYFHLPPSAAASIRDAIETIDRNIKVLVEEDNEFLLPCIADGYILLASLYNHAGDAKSAAKVLDSVESLLKGDKVRLCKLYAHRVVAYTDLGNLKEAENLGRKARAIADKLDILVPGQAEVLVETTGSLGGEALLHKAIRTNDLRDSDECYGLLSRTLEISEDLARAGYQSIYVDADLWHAKSAARFVLWHAFFEPTKISERVAEVRPTVEAPLKAGKYDVSGEYLKRTHFLGGFRALLAKKPPQPSEFLTWDLPSVQKGAPEWVLATALKYRGALKAHYGDADAQADFEEAARLLQHTQQPVLRIILWSIAVQAELSGISGPLFDRIFEYGIADAVDYLSWDPLMKDIVNRLLDNTHTDADLGRFQNGFAY